MILWLVISVGGNAVACQCGASDRGKSAWEIAKRHAEGAAVIFEGTPVRFDLHWNVLSATDGQLIVIDAPGEHGGGPRMAITFAVKRAYKGNLGSQVQLMTGAGGGDCGARFSPGLTYLVYAAFSTETNELTTSMCSPGGWAGESSVATDLRLLRHERPNPQELKPLIPLWKEPPDRQKRKYDQFRQQFTAATGHICGTVVSQQGRGIGGGSISFLAAEGYSPFDQPVAEVNENGSFCSDRLGPGRYYLYLNRAADQSAVFYPGVADHSRATPIDIAAGQEKSNVVFAVAPAKTYSVRGFISTNDRADLGGNDISVALISLDGTRATWRYEPIDFQSLFPLPWLKFYRFEHVPPGRYIAIASVNGKGWYTKKVDVNVQDRAVFANLSIVHKN